MSQTTWDDSKVATVCQRNSQYKHTLLLHLPTYTSHTHTDTHVHFNTLHVAPVKGLVGPGHVACWCRHSLSCYAMQPSVNTETRNLRACIRTHIHTYMDIRTCLHTDIHTNTHIICVHTHTNTHTHTCRCKYTHHHAHTYTNRRAHTHTQKYTYTHTHTQTQTNTSTLTP